MPLTSLIDFLQKFRFEVEGEADANVQEPNHEVVSHITGLSLPPTTANKVIQFW